MIREGHWQAVDFTYERVTTIECGQQTVGEKRRSREGPWWKGGTEGIRVTVQERATSLPEPKEGKFPEKKATKGRSEIKIGKGGIIGENWDPV